MNIYSPSGHTTHRTPTSLLRHSTGISFQPRTLRGQSSRHHASRYFSYIAPLQRGLKQSATRPSAASIGTTYQTFWGTMYATTKSISRRVKGLPLLPDPTWYFDW